MVPSSKVRKLKDFSKKESKSSEKTRTMRSKSISDIHRLKLRDENGKTLRKVSPGYDFIKRSKSSSPIGFKFLTFFNFFTRAHSKYRKPVCQLCRICWKCVFDIENFFWLSQFPDWLKDSTFFPMSYSISVHYKNKWT